jgi:hypothetical protein
MAEKGRLTVEQRVQTVLLFAESKSIVATQRGFVTRWAPSPKTIRRLHQQFQQNGSVLERNCGRAASVHTAQNIDAVRVAMQRSPGKSTRRGLGRINDIQTFCSANLAFRFASVPLQNVGYAKTY